jgi:hypothetical protein
MKIGVALVVALLVASAGPAAAQADRAGKNPTGSKKDAGLIKTPMIFYLAKGEPDACGQGCAKWIAAEGQFDTGAPQRLRAFLSRLGARKLPIYFRSSGGIQQEAMAIGRLLRARDIAAGVSRTIPKGCAAASEETCQALKQSGQELEAELHSVAVCNSACVYALIGAKVRQVPPGARLGVHSSRLVKLRTDGSVSFVSDGAPSTREKARRAELNGQTRRYLQEMGIDARLLDVISKVPYEQSHYLSRDEIAGFGIDTREFQETRWMVMELSPQPLSVLKFVVESKGADRKEFRISMVQLACAGPRRVRIVYFRGLGSDEIGATKTIKLAIDDRTILLPGTGSISKIDTIDTGGSFDTRLTYEWFEVFEAAAARDSIEIVESDPTGAATSSRASKLSTAGLAHAISVLRPRCGNAI